MTHYQDYGSDFTALFIQRSRSQLRRQYPIEGGRRGHWQRRGGNDGPACRVSDWLAGCQQSGNADRQSQSLNAHIRLVHEIFVAKIAGACADERPPA